MKYTFEMYSEDIKAISEFIKLHYSDPIIIGLVRGGAGIATHLSNILDCPAGYWDIKTGNICLSCSTEDKQIIFVDDILDTGKTFKDIQETITGVPFVFCTLLTKFPEIDDKYDTVIYSPRDAREEGWIDFWWEHV